MVTPEQTTKQTSNQVILVQACSWPVWQGNLLQIASPIGSTRVGDVCLSIQVKMHCRSTPWCTSIVPRGVVEPTVKYQRLFLMLVLILMLKYWLCPWDERNTNCCSFCFWPAAATACYGPIRARSGGAHTLWGWSTLLQGAILSSSIGDLNYPSPRPILLFLGVSSFISTLLCHWKVPYFSVKESFQTPNLQNPMN